MTFPWLQAAFSASPAHSTPTGLQGWIRSNDGRSAGLFLVFLLAMQVLCAVNLFIPLALLDARHAPFLGWGGYLTRYAPVILVGSVLWFAGEMFWHIETVKRAIGFRFIDDRDEPRLCKVIEPLIIQLGLPVPFVGVIESQSRNAFACGIARKKAVVVVTRGLIDSLTDAELACVLAHELSHIKNGDIRLMAAANIFMTRLRLLHKNNALKLTPVHVVLAFAVPAVLPLTLIGNFLGHLVLRAGQVSRLLIASSREFIADAEAVELTRNPAALASALVKVEQHYRVPGARNEEDAMMIAGETEGENATHPTVAQRIAALARTTGSMVFNAPGAIPMAEWERSPTLSQAKAAALLRGLPSADAIPRVISGSNVNRFGLTRNGLIMLGVAVAGLLFIHAGELNKPQAILAKFDIRPLSILLGSGMACDMTLSGGAPGFCTAKTNGAYRDFEGQKNTLAGWLADTSRKRREAGDPNADLTMDKFNTAGSVQEYRGISLRMKGVKTAMDGSGFPIEGGGGFSSEPPAQLTIAELDQVGCFPGHTLHGDPEGHWKIGDRSANIPTIEHLVEQVEEPVIQSSIDGADVDMWMHKYAEQREFILLASYDMYGFPGLRMALSSIGTNDHRKFIAKLGKRLSDPGFTKGMSPLDRAKYRALARNPDGFVPCVALRRLGPEGTL